MIPYGHQDISEENIKAVVEVLRSDYLTQGPAVPAFEQAICDYTEAKYGVAVNSGTSALHIACLALGLGEGDWLWTTPITFVASANCGLYCGAKVDFVDIDPISWNLSAEKLEEKLKEAEREGKLPKVVVAVHLCGLSCDMEKISNLSKQYGFSIIEDASHALGGQYQEKNIGNGQYSDISTFSFHPIKNITTGEGGMAVTNNIQLAEKMRRLRSHGITSDPALMTGPKHGLWYCQQIELGFNYRMSDVHAALGISQLKRLDEFIANRRSIAKRYDQALSGLSLQLPSK
ncbi:MAG: UDP-4-amino-4,6-dideoxy-N-acetyl-beta-L-altrosamine transaminase, partial [Candidatus Marinimicrobia bacterium]|nr:UDP-4-amino-4,6-dideoxy-N-acetyl-beta-L-altrosamine transaminase [Candidatus Neomarinimicrobiota bacterium]